MATIHQPLDRNALLAAVQALVPGKTVTADDCFMSVDGSPKVAVNEREHRTDGGMWHRSAKNGQRSVTISDPQVLDSNKVQVRCNKDGWDYNKIAQVVVQKAQAAIRRCNARDGYEATRTAVVAGFGLKSNYVSCLSQSPHHGATVKLAGLTKEQVLVILQAAQNVGVRID